MHAALALQALDTTRRFGYPDWTEARRILREML